MLGLALCWTIFEFSKYSNIGNLADIPPAELQLPQRKYLLPNFNSLGGNTSAELQLNRQKTSTPSVEIPPAELQLPQPNFACPSVARKAPGCARRKSTPTQLFARGVADQGI
ncbi:Hypothetical predicted protein [Prunus dulcis]|uniref:Uncharacterized protein n=1 Tax=Prunus dulcis TaxID=3755 RepID=A0A5E4FY67_PRUDU|nr:Hypothetical predicted protein [Prunus dulcis]